MKRSVAVSLALAGVLAAACDSGPSGPGNLVATVEGPSLGGVVLEVSGSGIVGFEGLSDTRVYAGPVPGAPNTHRVMLVHPTGGDLRFEIQVTDLGMEDPVFRVVSAAGQDNLTLLTAGIVARVER